MKQFKPILLKPLYGIRAQVPRRRTVFRPTPSYGRFHMSTPTDRCLIMIIGLLFALLTSACSKSLIQPRLLVVTGTLVGLEATPGNPNDGQTPAVTFGYRRAEAALVPVEKKDNDKEKADNNIVAQQDTNTPSKDAASILATFNLAHNWFGPAKIEQYIATGLAAQSIANSDYYALALIGYDQGTDEIADKLADAYRKSSHDQAARTCWKEVEGWMKTHFPGLPPLDIVTRAFINQRTKLFEDNVVKGACPEPAAVQPQGD